MDNTKKPELKNPRKGANFISQLLFLWLVPLMYKGARIGLNLSHLTKCLKEDSSDELGDKLEIEWTKELIGAVTKNNLPSFRKALFYAFYKSYILDGFLVLSLILIQCLMPAVLAQLLLQYQLKETVFNATEEAANGSFRIIGTFSEGKENQNIWDQVTDFLDYAWNDINWLSGCIVIMPLCISFLKHHSDQRQKMVGARMRIACCSLIYRKTLHLSTKVAGQTATGYLVNLLSNDVGRLDYAFFQIHYAWVLPLQSALVCYLMWQSIGVASVVGVVGLLTDTVPLQTYLIRKSSVIRMRVAKRTDERVNIMNEIINGIQVIKMYTWQKPFNAVVALARKKEINQIKWACYIRGFYLSTVMFASRFALLNTVITCVLFKKPITANIVFSVAQFLNTLQLNAAVVYPSTISSFAEALVSIGRIQDFLMLEDHQPSVKCLHRNDAATINPSEEVPAIHLNNVCATWENYKQKTLNFLSMNVKRGSLCAIIGPVGSGKSSFLQLLLGELPVYSGDICINGEISYGSQEPWLFTESIRNNILFGQAFDKKRYHDVIKYCALRTDLMQLPNGDKTIVGERGTALSGGQRARVSLARAVYKSACIYLLDDPLSAVDAHVGKFLFDECIGSNGYLAQQGATRVLVTHQVHFLTEADWIVILDEGKVLAQGTYSDLSKSEIDFGKLLQREEKQNDDDIGGDIIEDYKSVIEETANSEKGLTLRSSSASVTRSSSRSVSIKSNITEAVGRQVAEHKEQGKVSFHVWKTYFCACDNYLVLAIMVISLILSQAIGTSNDYFVAFMTHQEYLRVLGEPTVLSTWGLISVYGGLILGVVVMMVIRNYLFFNICMQASKKLHNKMFTSILNAPMRFFDTIPSGRILNRFSKDMGAIDELLPKVMVESTQIILVMLGLLVMISIVNYLLLVPLSIALLLFGLLLRFYLPTVQDIKRMEGITRSPVFSHLSATLSGLSTIRVNGVEKRVAREFDELQNVHSSVWQLMISNTSALGLWLDCVSISFVACVTYSFVVLQGIYSSSVGLAISQALILTGMVQYGIRQATETIQQMTSVERVLQYTNLPQEQNKGNEIPAKSWPQKGKIEFKGMSLVYDMENGSAVLKNLNLNIEPMWKVGIVGRTGAGKSSLISALFRLAHIDGSIVIDGIDTGSIELEGLRSKISIIPQDPVLFSATIRYNLDPFNRYRDDELWRALTQVELKQAIGGLDYMVTEGGSNFSVGQRQLICLARAILRNNKILVLDEATANVDPQTDSLIQTTIREKFRDCTVLTVAHRLHTVMDSDRILVMDAGFAKEFDVPHKLLQSENGILRNMVEATGPEEAESLKRIAAETFAKMNIELAPAQAEGNLRKFKEY